MAIIIRNLGGNMFGECEYELCINENLIAKFKHNRPDGLAVCLRKASDAAEKAKWVEMARWIEEYCGVKKMISEDL